MAVDAKKKVVVCLSFVLVTFISVIFLLILILLVRRHCLVSLMHLANDYESLLTIRAEYKCGLSFVLFFLSIL